MQIGDEVYIHGYVDELRGDTVIIRNAGGYFGTARSEVKPNDEDIGKTCYKIYVIAPRRRFPNTYYDYYCDVPRLVEFWKERVLQGDDVTLYAKARPFTKSDRSKLGRTVFWTKEEAEKAIGIVHGSEVDECVKR